MRRALSNVFHLGVKELRSLFTDPVLMPLLVYVFTLAVYMVANGTKFEVENAAVAVADEDRSSLSREIASSFIAPYFKPAAMVQAQEIDRLLDQGRYVFVLHIPSGFERDLLAGRRPALQLNVDATAMAQAGNGAAYAQSIILQTAREYLKGKTASAGETPVNVVTRAMFNPNLSSVWFASVMQIINNITILSLVLSGAALIREREHGTIEHLLVMPVAPAEIMMAKIAANALVILLAALLSLRVMVMGVIGVPMEGSFALFASGAALYLFATTSLGLLLATFARSMGQYGLLTIPVIIVMNLLSGSTTPMESMPEWLQLIMQLSPSTQFVAFAQGVLYRGAGLDVVWPRMLAILAIATVLFVISRLRFAKAMMQE